MSLILEFLLDILLLVIYIMWQCFAWWMPFLRPKNSKDEAVEEPIPGSSEGAKTSLQALIAENTRQTDDGGHFCLICVTDLHGSCGHCQDLVNFWLL